MDEKNIRLATTADLQQILQIYAAARQFMAQNGNPTQWGDSYPQKILLEEDLRRDRLYVVERAGKICGVFMFAVGADPTYSRIDGNWGSGETYGVIHRVAGIGGGIFAAVLEYCSGQISHLRIDTHADNHSMQHILERNGFQRRGTVYVADGSPRIAYDRI